MNLNSTERAAQGAKWSAPERLISCCAPSRAPPRYSLGSAEIAVIARPAAKVSRGVGPTGQSAANQREGGPATLTIALDTPTSSGTFPRAIADWAPGQGAWCRWEHRSATLAPRLAPPCSACLESCPAIQATRASATALGQIVASHELLSVTVAARTQARTASGPRHRGGVLQDRGLCAREIRSTILNCSPVLFAAKFRVNPDCRAGQLQDRVG